LRTVDKVALETKEQMSQPRTEKMDKTVKKKTELRGSFGYD
jgi:hypothetical protein